MESMKKFVQEHLDDDLTRLILDRKKWPEIDMDLAVSCIESRRKLRNKVRTWYDCPDLIFPVSLSAEQCSSSATARYKAVFAAATAGKAMRIADLTGGLGVDSMMFSEYASAVLYNEMQQVLCEAARHNFPVLGADNIEISNCMIDEDSAEEVLSSFRPDIVFLDPARRGDGGRKVFLIEECTPDVLTLRSVLFRHSRFILVKLSPMADISMACSRLGSTCREVHTVSVGGECKELLILMDREWTGEYAVTAVELPTDYPVSEPSSFTFRISEEKDSSPEFARKEDIKGFLFEPGKSIMKSGCFNLIAERFGIRKIGRSTHYYVTEDPGKAESLKSLGKIYGILDCLPLDKRTLKAIGKEYPRAEVTARNIPMDTRTLRTKLGVTSGDDAHIFGLKSDMEGNLLLVTSRA